MSISITVGNFEELKELARQVLSTGKAQPAQRAQSIDVSLITAPVQTTAAPTMTPVQLAAPATQPAPVQPTTAPTTQPAPVQTTQPTYSMDDLGRAGMALMDAGRQADLQQLLMQFGVGALPSLPTAQYGAFATALRGLGAPI